MMPNHHASASFDSLAACSSTRVVAEGQAFSSERRGLPLDPIDPALIEEGAPVARGVTLSRSADGRLSSGLWECSAGAFAWTFWLDEIFLVLDGEARIREETGAVHDLRQGDVAHFPLGLEVRWEIPRHFRKLFVVRSPGGSRHIARWMERLRIAALRARGDAAR